MNNNSNRQPNNNNNNNNRRRGRNNNNSNRQQQNNRSGFDYQNSIDNRARGNAAQMLEKYKKLASDAQFNGDRVNAEYHLQFADHYFRVLADFRGRQEVRQDQQGERRPREDARDDRDDWQNEDRSPSYEEQSSNEGADAEAADDNADNNDDDRRPQRDNRPRRNDRPERSGSSSERPERSGSERPERNSNDRPERSNTERSGNRAPRRHHSEEPADEPAGLDLAVLPPSIAIANDFDDVEVEAKPARKPRARRPKSANDEDVATAAE